MASRLLFFILLIGTRAFATTGEPSTVQPFCSSKRGLYYYRGGNESGLMRLTPAGKEERVGDWSNEQPNVPADCEQLEGPVDLSEVKLEARTLSAGPLRLSGNCFSPWYQNTQRVQVGAATLAVGICAARAAEGFRVALYHRKGSNEGIAVITAIGSCNEGGYPDDVIARVGSVAGLAKAKLTDEVEQRERRFPFLPVDLSISPALAWARSELERGGAATEAISCLEDTFNGWVGYPPDIAAMLALRLAELYARTKQSDQAQRALARALSWPDERARISKEAATSRWLALLLKSDPRFRARLTGDCCADVHVERSEHTRDERVETFESGRSTLATHHWVDGILAPYGEVDPRESPDRHGRTLPEQDSLFDLHAAVETTGRLADGIREGEWVTSVGGERAVVTQWSHGVPEGPWRFYFRAGVLRLERTFIHGRRAQELEWYPSGKKRCGIGADTVMRCWHPNGELALIDEGKARHDFRADGTLASVRFEAQREISCTFPPGGHVCELSEPASHEALDFMALIACDDQHAARTFTDCPSAAAPPRREPDETATLELLLVPWAGADLGSASAWTLGLQLGPRMRDQNTERNPVQIGFSVGPDLRAMGRPWGRTDAHAVGATWRTFFNAGAWGTGVTQRAAFAWADGWRLGTIELGVYVRFHWLEVGYAFQFPLFAPRPPWLSEHQLCVRFAIDLPLKKLATD